MNSETPHWPPVDPNNEIPVDDTGVQATIEAAASAQRAGLSPGVVQLILSTNYAIPLDFDIK